MDRPGDQGGVQIKHLTPGSKPQAVFALTQGDSVVSAYAYCNLHGLWKALNPVPVKLKRAPGTVFRGRSVIYCSELFSSHFDRR